MILTAHYKERGQVILRIKALHGTRHAKLNNQAVLYTDVPGVSILAYDTRPRRDRRHDPQEGGPRPSVHGEQSRFAAKGKRGQVQLRSGGTLWS